MSSTHRVLDNIAKLDETLNGVDIHIHHLDEEQNFIALEIGSADYTAVDITGEELNEICRTFNVDAEALTVYASSDSIYMDREKDNHALLVEVDIPVPENESEWRAAADLYRGDHTMSGGFKW